MLSALLSLFLLGHPPSASDLVVPNFPDLIVKTRSLTVNHQAVVTLWFFKGARQRVEIHSGGANEVVHPSIYQCDKGVRYFLNESTKTYNTIPLDPAELRKTATHLPQPEMSGAEVTVTIDSVDTGERKYVGSYEARRVKTTTTVVPGPGAVSQPNKTEVDGWYIDIPGRNCQDSSTPQMGWLHVWSGRQDRVVFKRLGTAPLGLAIEQTSTKTEAGRTDVIRTELVDISEEHLDDSLFEPPPDYSPAPPARTPTNVR